MMLQIHLPEELEADSVPSPVRSLVLPVAVGREGEGELTGHAGP